MYYYTPVRISIHAAREGGDYLNNDNIAELMISIHAAREGGDRRKLVSRLRKRQFQSTPPVKAATVSEQTAPNGWRISIHAAREGGDAARMPKVRNDEISIHAAREGGDATPMLLFGLCMHISIHAAREGGDQQKQQHRAKKQISIHAAREGGDPLYPLVFLFLLLFQSTPPVKAATQTSFSLLGYNLNFNPRRP